MSAEPLYPDITGNRNGQRQLDIVGIGCATVDELLVLETFPVPETKVHIIEEKKQCGGLVSTALVAAARLGAQCAYHAVLGSDEHSAFVTAALEQEGIAIETIIKKDAARPIHSRILIDRQSHTRTILFNRAGVSWLTPQTIDLTLVRSTTVVYLDHYGLNSLGPLAADLRSRGIDLVADIERDITDDIFNAIKHINHLILPAQFAWTITGTENSPEALEILWNDGRDVVVITEGADGSWCRVSKQAAPFHIPAFEVSVVDTTGCGDVFHGAYAFALSKGYDLMDRLRIATAAAAINAGYWGAQDGSPTFETVHRFLSERGITIRAPRESR